MYQKKMILYLNGIINNTTRGENEEVASYGPRRPCSHNCPKTGFRRALCLNVDPLFAIDKINGSLVIFAHVHERAFF